MDRNVKKKGAPMPSKHLRKLALLVAVALLAVPAAAKEKKAVFKPADQYKWADMPGSPAGITTQVLWGDPAKGPSGALHKFAAGTQVPFHHHTAEHRIVVVSGTMIFTPDGGTATRMPAGSYAHFAGGEKHTTACDAASECVVFVDAKGKWDVVPEAPKK